MTNQMKAALAECVAYLDRKQDYWWRTASMKKLAELGYVEECHPEYSARNGYRGKARTFRPTRAGRGYLAGLP